MFSRALGSAAATSTMVSPSASRPRSKISAASSALSLVDSAAARRRAARRGRRAPLCDSSHCPSVNGADADASIGIPTLAERTAATTHPLRNAGATDANDASPHSGAALRQRRAAPSPSKKPTPQPSAFISPCFCRRGEYDCTSRPVRRIEHQRSHRDAARPASRGGDTSDVPGQSDAGEDLPADRVVPVAEARPQDVGGDRPRSAAQHLVVAAPNLEERLRCTARRSSA